MNNTPNMTGSEKQIAWATAIRTRVLRWIQVAKSEIPDDKHAAFDGMFAAALSKTDAKWWIDNLRNIAEVSEDLRYTFAGGGAHQITPGRWQKELQPVIAAAK